MPICMFSKYYYIQEEIIVSDVITLEQIEDERHISSWRGRKKNASKLLVLDRHSSYVVSRSPGTIP